MPEVPQNPFYSNYNILGKKSIYN